MLAPELHTTAMGNFVKAVGAGIGAKLLTGSILGFVVVFVLLYWLFGGS